MKKLLVLLFIAPFMVSSQNYCPIEIRLYDWQYLSEFDMKYTLLKSIQKADVSTVVKTYHYKGKTHKTIYQINDHKRITKMGVLFPVRKNVWSFHNHI